MAAAYAIYHGPDGLQDIAKRCLGLAKAASAALNKAGIEASEPAFDTITVKCDSAAIAAKAEAAGFNLRVFGPDEVGLSFGETVTARTFCRSSRTSSASTRGTWTRWPTRPMSRAEIICSPTPSSTRTRASRRCSAT